MDMVNILTGLICMSKNGEDRTCYDSCPFKKKMSNGNSCNYMVSVAAMQKMTDQAGEIAQLKQDYEKLHRRWTATQPG